MTNSTVDAPVWFVTGCSTGFGLEFVGAGLLMGSALLRRRVIRRSSTHWSPDTRIRRKRLP